MRLIFLCIAIAFTWVSKAGAQTVSNLQFSQSGKQIEVTYDLYGRSDNVCFVSIYCSQNGGTTWGNILYKVSGDVGKNIKPGTGKKITWDVLSETDKLVGEIRFKVEALNMSGCQNFTVTHTAGDVAPVTKTVTYTVVETDLTGSKKCWITQNLGADRQATSATDETEASAGWYWQFDRKQGFKFAGNTRIPNTNWITSISETSNWLPANDPCSLLLGSEWRLPSKKEWETADESGGWDNYNKTLASVLKLRAAGYLYYGDGSLYNRGSYGYYWSSSQSSSDYGWNLYFNSGYCNMSNNDKANGFSARCLKDN